MALIGFTLPNIFSQSVPHGVSTSSPGQTESTANNNGGQPRTTKRAYAGAFFSDARLVNDTFCQCFGHTCLYSRSLKIVGTIFSLEQIKQGCWAY